MTSNLKSLDEVLKERREHYVAKALAAADSVKLEKLKHYFEAIADEVYGSRNLSSIADFESNVDSGTLRVSFKFGNLEEIVDEIRKTPVVSSGLVDSVEARVESPDSSSVNPSSDKPVLTYEIFIREKDNGLTLAQIKDKYHVPIANQLGAFSVNYKNLVARRNQGVTSVSHSEPVVQPPASPTADGSSKPLLTYDDYRSSRDSGLSHEQIRERFSVPNPGILGPYASAYKRRGVRADRRASDIPIDSNQETDGSSKPLISYESYRDLRDKGAAHEEIARGYSFKSRKHEGSFRGNYTRAKNVKLRAGGSLKCGVKQPDESSDDGQTHHPITPGLDYSIYRSRRDAGKSDDEIRTEFSVATNNRRFMAFQGTYNRWVLGVKRVKTDDGSEVSQSSSDAPRNRPLPRLTQYQYNQARMRGWNRETIMSRFRDVDESMIPTLEQAYQAQLQRALDEITSPDRPKSDNEGENLS